MAEYEGPNFYKPAKNEAQHSSTKRLKENLQLFHSRKKIEESNDLFSEKHTHTLPGQIKKREEIEKGFQEYLKDKKVYTEPNRSKHYIAPPFEASKVPSPVFGYKQPTKKIKQEWDYTYLKNELKKEFYEFILFEEFETPELREYWEMQFQDTEKIGLESRSEKLPVHPEPMPDFERVQPDAQPADSELSPEDHQNQSKKNRLKRSLMSIIQEEQLGKNEAKRNIPGFFSDNNE